MLGTPEERLAVLERKVDAINARGDNSGALVAQLVARIEILSAELEHKNGLCSRLESQLRRKEMPAKRTVRSFGKKKATK
jgi:hypothetical protein